MNAINNNVVPYLVMIVMGFMIYILWQANEAKDIEIAKANKYAKQNEFNMGVVQQYNEQRFDELAQIKMSKWKKGKQHGSF